MSLTRSQAMLRIEGQRRAIREHIQKFDHIHKIKNLRLEQSEFVKMKSKK